MKISTSILSIQEEKEKNIQKLGFTSTDYIHLDVMDSNFVSNKVDFLDQQDILLETKKPLDIHFMVEDVESYVEKYKSFNPTYMTFHIEVKKDIPTLIQKIKEICKVGISIKPNTEVKQIESFLKDIDLVLVMSVEPGLGGQKFMEDMTNKIEELYLLREQNHYHFEIEVDGGINCQTIQKISKADIAVVGSYITNSDDYEKQIRNLVN